MSRGCDKGHAEYNALPRVRSLRMFAVNDIASHLSSTETLES